MDEFDYVVVGAGSAGCVLAARLAEAGNKVCVLEAGPNDWNPYIHIPAGYIKNVFSETLTWGFVSEPVPGINGRQIPLTQGRGVGGSSSLNGMVYSRGQRGDFDTWAQMGNPGWSYDDVLPFFKKSERRIGDGDPAYHGFDGRLTVADPEKLFPLSDTFIAAAKDIGFPHVRDQNAGDQREGVTTWQFTVDPTGRRRVRMSSARAFLKPALKSGNISLRTNSSATRVLFENGKGACGVEYRAGKPGSPILRVRARRDVILSSGAINTPRLLQISGVGPQEHLRSIGVDVVRDVPGVGANLVDHLGVRITAKVRNAESVNERSRGLPLLWEGVKWAFGKPSILAMPPMTMCLYIRSSPHLERPDVQIAFTPGSYREGFPGALEPYPGVTLGGYRQRPESRGYVRARSKDIDVQPAIQPNYLSTRGDQEAAVAVVRTARRLFAAPSFAPYIVEETFPGVSVERDDEIIAFARQYGNTVYHHTGTARMGPDGDKMSVVDARLRVRGLQGLRVADNSIIPAHISGATNATAIMIGEKAASIILQDAQARAA